MERNVHFQGGAITSDIQYGHAFWDKPHIPALRKRERVNTSFHAASGADLNIAYNTVGTGVLYRKVMPGNEERLLTIDDAIVQRIIYTSVGPEYASRYRVVTTPSKSDLTVRNELQNLVVAFERQARWAHAEFRT